MSENFNGMWSLLKWGWLQMCVCFGSCVFHESLQTVSDWMLTYFLGSDLALS